jgi:hypothetical protein
MAAAAALPLKFSPNFFVKSPQKWILQIVGDGARRARTRGERCKALFIHAKKPPQIKEKKEKRKNLSFLKRKTGAFAPKRINNKYDQISCLLPKINGRERKTSFVY